MAFDEHLVRRQSQRRTAPGRNAVLKGGGAECVDNFRDCAMYSHFEVYFSTHDLAIYSPTTDFTIFLSRAAVREVTSG